MIESVSWRGGEEMLLRLGAGSPVTCLVLPALFEEANRMRRFTVSVMHCLADRRIGTILPDLPGTGESLEETRAISLADWRAFVLEMRRIASLSIAFRGGSILDSAFPSRWRLAPETGERLLRDMVRATALSTGLSATEIDAQARVVPMRLAGNLIDPDLYRAFHAAAPEGNAFVSQAEGPRLWRSAEPGDDPHYAEAVADEIAAWVTSCAAI